MYEFYKYVLNSLTCWTYIELLLKKLLEIIYNVFIGL